MTTVRRLTLASALLGLAALLTSTEVWGEAGKDKKDAKDRPDPAPAKVGRLADELALTKFSKKPVVTYKTQDGDTLVGLQVKPKLDPAPARPRDLLILVDTSASQVGTPLAAARELAEAVAAAAGRDDRVAVWTLNIPAATKPLTKGFKPAKSDEVRDALAALKAEVPFGAVDLKGGLTKAAATFDKEGRQRAVVFLGNGMSIHSPVDNKDRADLCAKLVQNEVCVFPIPLGPRTQLERGSPNLHGFATGTGGLVVRHLPDAEYADTAKRLNEALAAPVLYTTKFQAPAELTEFFPHKLPPLRTDAPTLVVGKMKAAEKVSYTVEGKVVDKPVKVTMTEEVTPAEVDNFFLVSLVDQWKKADHDTPALIRADRALALAFEQNRLARDELLAQAQWAVAENKLAAADDLFALAKKIDPNDPEADAGRRIVEMLRTGALNKDKLKNALSKPTDPGMKIEGKGKFVRGELGKLVAQADPKDKMPAEKVAPPPDAPPVPRDEFLRQEKARLAIEEQRITGIVADAERQARRLLATDPDAAHDLLKRTLASIRDNPDLSAATRQALSNRLQNALLTVDTQGARIKQDLDQRLRAMADAQRRLALDAERVRGEELIRAKMVAFDGLMNKGRFEEAYKEALVMQQAAVDTGAGIPPAMTAAYTMGVNAYNVREVQEVRRASEERFLLTMLQVDKSHIPFPDEPPVQFPPAATWRALTDRRKGIYDSFGLGEGDPRVAQKLNDELSKPVNLPEGIPANSTLKDALDFLSDKYHLTFVIDENAFAAIEVQKVADQNVALPKMVGVSLSTVLRLLLGQIKGNRYTGTYIIRRDYIEITTTYNAAAEKTVRAYPVADLVVPIPNAVNQQALQQNLQVYGQYQASQNPFQFQQNLNPFAPPNPFQVNPNPSPVAFNPQNQPGFNQFGNLGGQFGLQGTEKSYELLQLVTKVVAPGEWQPLGPNPNAQNNPPGFGPGPLPLPAQPPDEQPLVDRPLLNGIDYYQPARALIVRGSTRIHTRLGGGLVGPNPMGGPPPMGALERRPDGALVIGPNRNKDPKVAGDGGEKVRPKPADLDPKKVWTDALVKIQNDPKADHTGLVIAVADFLVKAGKFDHAAEFLKAELRLGILSRPWVYEALALALQLSGGSADEIERAQLSAIDLEPTDAQGYLRAARAMVELKRADRAVALCKQAALMQPNAPEAYANALVYAEVSKDGDAMSWAAGNILKRDWPLDNEFLHGQARQSLDELAKVLQKDRKADAERMLQAANQVRVRDLVIQLTWQCEAGEADLDLKVKEPIGTYCSFLQRQTPGGGTLLGDSVTDGTRETYVAPEAFSGEYEVTVEKVRGRTLNNKAIVEVIRHQGTPGEARERHSVSLEKGTATLKVQLADGRRTSVATVPPTAPRAERIVDDPASGDRVLNKLRAMTDPVLRENGMRAGGGAAGGHSLRTQPLPTAQGPAKVEYQAKVPGTAGADVMAQSVIDPKTGRPGLKLNPVFQTVGGRPQSTIVTNPLIPGGF